MKMFTDVMDTLKLSNKDVANALNKPPKWVQMILKGELHLSKEGEGKFVAMASEVWSEFTDAVLWVVPGTLGTVNKVGHLQRFMNLNGLTNKAFGGMVGVTCEKVAYNIKRDMLNYESICMLKQIGELYDGWDELESNLVTVYSNGLCSSDTSYPGAIFVDNLHGYVSKHAKVLGVSQYHVALLRTTPYPKRLLSKLVDATANGNHPLLRKYVEARKVLSVDPRVGIATNIATAVLSMTDVELQAVLAAMPKVK